MLRPHWIQYRNMVSRCDGRAVIHVTPGPTLRDYELMAIHPATGRKIVWKSIPSIEAAMAIELPDGFVCCCSNEQLLKGEIAMALEEEKSK